MALLRDAAAPGAATGAGAGGASSTAVALGAGLLLVLVLVLALVLLLITGAGAGAGGALRSPAAKSSMNAFFALAAAAALSSEEVVAVVAETASSFTTTARNRRRRGCRDTVVRSLKLRATVLSATSTIRNAARMADKLGRWQAFRGVDGRKEHRQRTLPSRCLSILAGVTASTLQKWYRIITFMLTKKCLIFTENGRSMQRKSQKTADVKTAWRRNTSTRVRRRRRSAGGRCNGS